MPERQNDDQQTRRDKHAPTPAGLRRGQVRRQLEALAELHAIEKDFDPTTGI